MKTGLPGILILLFALGPSAAAESTSLFQEGERLFRENRPEAALPLLEQAIRDPSVDERAFIYLAVAYQQIGRLDDGIATLRKGLPQAKSLKHLFYFDMGNFFRAQGKASFARDMFDSAIQADSTYAPAWLNRGLSNVLLSNFRGARDDFVRYLELDPQSTQREAIAALIARFAQAIAEEDKRMAAAEAAQAAEDLARKNLLDEVSASLKAAAEETTNLAAGSGAVQGYGDELPLSD
jgi:tetratricopeptide (TPR) repeat protein